MPCFAFGNPANFKNRQLIADFALKSRLPSLCQEKLFVESGGLLSYAPSYMGHVPARRDLRRQDPQGSKPGRASLLNSRRRSNWPSISGPPRRSIW